ncbi:MAG: TRAP transporter small permease [Arenimonas sp.]
MLDKAQQLLHRFETYLLAALLTALLLLSVGQILLRVFFDTGFIWAEPVSRQGVLWLALLGALSATREKKQISIDALSRLLPPKTHQIVWTLTQLAAATVTAALTWYGWGMVQLEREAPGIFVANIPSWWPMCVFVAGFGLISLRFVFSAFSKPAEPSA